MALFLPSGHLQPVFPFHAMKQFDVNLLWSQILLLLNLKSPTGRTHSPHGEMVWSIWNESWHHLIHEQTLKAIHNPMKSKCTSKVY